MKANLRKIGKWFFRIFILFLLLECLHLGILAYPHFLFDYSHEFQQYNLYSDQPFTENIDSIISNVDERLRELEVYDNNFSPDIFICYNPKLYAVFPTLTGKNTRSSGLNISLVNNTFINVERINRLAEVKDPRVKYSHIAGELPQVIAHELVHNLVTNKIGYWSARNLPLWKAEGYAEYGSTITMAKRDTSYSFTRKANLYFDGVIRVPFHSRQYLEAQLLVEYLMEYKGISIDELFAHDFAYENAFNSLNEFLKQ